MTAIVPAAAGQFALVVLDATGDGEQITHHRVPIVAWQIEDFADATPISVEQPDDGTIIYVELPGGQYYDCNELGGPMDLPAALAEAQRTFQYNARVAREGKARRADHLAKRDAEGTP